LSVVRLIWDVGAVITHFPASGIWLKLRKEPIIPKPGPTFPIVAADPEKAERISTPRAVKIRAEKKTMPM
jgi:hypothetical protein